MLDRAFSSDLGKSQRPRTAWFTSDTRFQTQTDSIGLCLESGVRGCWHLTDPDPQWWGAGFAQTVSTALKLLLQGVKLSYPVLPPQFFSNGPHIRRPCWNAWQECGGRFMVWVQLLALGWIKDILVLIGQTCNFRGCISQSKGWIYRILTHDQQRIQHD